MLNKCVSASLIVASSMSFVAGITQAQTTRMVPSQYPTIQSAIDASQTGDTVIVADGSYAGADLSGKAITVRSQNGAAACIVVVSSGSGFRFASGETRQTVVQGFNIQGVGVDSRGAVFLNSAGTMRSCVIDSCHSDTRPGNTSVCGAGVYVLASGTAPLLDTCTIRNCVAVKPASGYCYGGGLGVDGNCDLVDCEISNNSTSRGSQTSAFESNGAPGGGVFCSGGVVMFTRCLIADNAAGAGQNSTLCPEPDGAGPGGFGGGVYAQGCQLTLTLSRILRNSAGRGGDGYSCASTGFFTFPGMGGSGGGMYVTGGSVALIGCVIADNSAGAGGTDPLNPVGMGGDGGAIVAAVGATVIAENTTIIHNHAGASMNRPAGRGAVAAFGNSSLALQNSLLWGNAGSGGSVLASQLYYEFGSVSVTQCCLQGFDSSITGTGNFGNDPLLADADGRLLSVSPCIDAGDTSLVPASLTMDVFGGLRLWEDAGMPNTGVGTPPVDIGAYEYPGTSCYGNCDGSSSLPVLNVADFTCFLQRFAASDPYANCDGSASIPVLNIADFTCFLQKFAAGCP